MRYRRGRQRLNHRTGTRTIPAKVQYSRIEPPTTTARDPFQAPWLVFWAAFAVRVLYITLAHTYRIKSFDDHLPFGQEMGRIARALATGYGFSDPFRGHTGPTAWVGPLFPLLLGGVFKLFGVFTAQSAWVIFTLNSLFSALTVRMVWEIGARCFNRKVALWSAWLWALYPAAMQYAVRWVWETSITTAIFAWVIVLALRMRGIAPASESDVLRSTFSVPRSSAQQPTNNEQRTTSWTLFGLAWGLIALSN